MTTAATAHDTHGSDAALHEGAFGWIATVDHKKIGILYLLTSLFFFAIGGCEALVIRLLEILDHAHHLAMRHQRFGRNARFGHPDRGCRCQYLSPL